MIDKKKSAVVLDTMHWTHEDYRERMTTKQWREILLSGKDTFIFQGRLRQAKARNLGCGVVEIYKLPYGKEAWNKK